MFVCLQCTLTLSFDQTQLKNNPCSFFWATFVCWKKINPENALDFLETHYCKWLYSETWTKIWVYNYRFLGVILCTCMYSEFVTILRIVEVNKIYCFSLEIIVLKDRKGGGGVHRYLNFIHRVMVSFVASRLCFVYSLFSFLHAFQIHPQYSDMVSVCCDATGCSCIDF